MSEQYEKLFKKIVEELMPDFGGYMKFPVKGLVKKSYGSPGEYMVDVQPLKNNETEADEPLLTGVELPSVCGGSGWGLLCLPEIGQPVTVGFYRGDPDDPFVMNIRSFGQKTPGTVAGEMRLQLGDTYILFNPDGSINVEGKNPVTLHSTGVVNVNADVAANITSPLVTIAASIGVTMITPLLAVSGLIKALGIAAGAGANPVSGKALIEGSIEATVDVKDGVRTMAEDRTISNGHDHNENGMGGGVTDPPNQQL